MDAALPGLTLPDLDDRHVLAAAIAGRADVIVTKNLKDFPPAALQPHGIEAQHPDTFLIHQRGLSEQAFPTALRKVELVLVASELEKTKALL